MHTDHSAIFCFVIGLLWTISVVSTLLSFIDYDLNRMTKHSYKLYKRFQICLVLLGAFSSIFVIHGFFHL